MTIEELRKKWNLAKSDLYFAQDDDEKHSILRYAKSISDVAFELYGIDLAQEEQASTHSTRPSAV